VNNSFQARLSGKLNNLHKKLLDNSIKLAGSLTDVMRLSITYSKQGDKQSCTVTGLDVIELMFPKLEDIPLKKILGSGFINLAVFKDEEVDPIVCLTPMVYDIKAGDFILKYLENPANTNPWVLLLEVKDILGTFGDRSLLYQKIQLSYPDGVIPSQVTDYILDMASRRETLKW
jgi:hypothetical protein